MSEATSIPTTPPPTVPDQPVTFPGAPNGVIRPEPRHFFDGVVQPDAYGCPLSGTCMAPVLNDGDMLLLSPAGLPQPGNFVLLIPAQGGTPWLKRLVLAPMLPVGNPLHPDSDVAPVLIVDMLNPPRRFIVSTDRLAAMHRVVGVIRKEEVAAARTAAARVRKPARPRKGEAA